LTPDPSRTDDARRCRSVVNLTHKAKSQRRALCRIRLSVPGGPGFGVPVLSFAVLAYSACHVGELVKLRVRDFRTNGEHRVLNITGKGKKERTTPLHMEGVEKLAAWLALPGIGDNLSAPLFRPQKSVRGGGRDGFRPKPMTTRAVEKLIERYVKALGLDPKVTVHSIRVTAPTTARERGSDIIDLQDFAGHADPRTTLTSIRSRDRLSKSPVYVLKY
jgi:integrase/recombinase XerD